MECSCPSGGGIKNGHIRYASYEGTQEKNEKKQNQETLQVIETDAFAWCFDQSYHQCGSILFLILGTIQQMFTLVTPC